jgi:solute carrier family 8 (sodium/calcium exchanger)
LQYILTLKEAGWSQQFKNAILLGPTINEDDLVVDDVTVFEALTHFLTIGWKIFFALIPPRDFWQGWAAFFVSLFMIGVVTAIVAEFANMFGCMANVKQSVTAITFVALGTSLPDTFASVTAANSSEFADAAIGNVTGSNCVNVFLGLGLPWLIATIYHKNKYDQNYYVPSGTLSFSVAFFLIVSVLCLIILVIRRYTIGGELGGPTNSKWVSAVILICLWLFYIVMSTLKAYDLISIAALEG